MNAFFLVSLFLYSIRAATQWSNSTHQIYTFDVDVDLGTNAPDGDIDCTATNCIIECLTPTSCNDRSIYAFNANNQSSISLNCVHAGACSNAAIHMLYARNSHLSVVCHEQRSCVGLQIDVDGISTTTNNNTVTISCNDESACEEMHIVATGSVTGDWLTISSFTDETELTLFCGGDSDTAMDANASLVSMDGEIRCVGHPECCPSRYRSAFNVSSFYTTPPLSGEDNDDAWMSTTDGIMLGETDNWFLFEPLQNCVVVIFWLTALYAVVVFIWACIYNCCHTFRASAQCKSAKSLQDMEQLRRRLRTHSNVDDVPSNLDANEDALPPPSACSTVYTGSSKWNVVGYVVDVLMIVTDIVLAVAIYVYRPHATEHDLWSLAGYVSIGAMSFGVSLFMLKFIIMARFYAHINAWRMKIRARYPAQSDVVSRVGSPRAKSPKIRSPRSLKSPKRSTTTCSSQSDDQKLLSSSEQRHRHAVSAWHYIQSKRAKIHAFLTHIAMFDLLNASLQLAPNVMVVCYLVTDLAVAHSHDDGDDADALLLWWSQSQSQTWQQWTFLEWLLRCKLLLGVACMLYTVLNAMSVECKLCDCKADKLRDKKTIRPPTGSYTACSSEADSWNAFFESHDSLSTGDGRGGFVLKQQSQSAGKLMNPIYSKVDQDEDAVERSHQRSRSSLARMFSRMSEQRRSRPSFLETSKSSIYKPTVLAAANLMSIGQRRASRSAAKELARTEMVATAAQIQNQSSVAAAQKDGNDTVIGLLIGDNDQDEDEDDDECQQLNAIVNDDASSRTNLVRQHNARQDSMLSMSTVAGHDAGVMLHTMVLTPSHNQLSDDTHPRAAPVLVPVPVHVHAGGCIEEETTTTTWPEKRLRVVVNDCKHAQVAQRNKAVSDLLESDNDEMKLEGSEPSQNSNTPQTDAMHIGRFTPQTMAYSADESQDNTLILAIV